MKNSLNVLSRLLVSENAIADRLIQKGLLTDCYNAALIFNACALVVVPSLTPDCYNLQYTHPKPAPCLVPCLARVFFAEKTPEQ